MNNYLYRITTKRTNVWSNEKPYPVYYVARNKKEVMQFTEERLKDGLSVKSISCLGEQLAPHIYSGKNKNKE